MSGRAPRKGEKLFTVGFAARFSVQVWAKNEDTARLAAIPVAERANQQFGDMTVQEEDWISINSEKITDVTQEDPDE